MTLDQLIPGASVTVGGRTGEVDRVGSDVVYVWFGLERAVDRARVTEELPLNEVLGLTALAAELLPLKMVKAGQVDERTSQIIGRGFEYPAGSGNFFSLSLASQSNLTNAFVNRAAPGFTYPVKWATADNQVVLSIAGPTDLTFFYGSALAYVRAARESGNDLKELIVAAQTVEALEAIVDTR